jgi:hypothetical protein
MTYGQRAIVMAGEGPPSTTLLLAAKEVMDAGLRRHDELGVAGESVFRAPGIIPHARNIDSPAGVSRHGG